MTDYSKDLQKVFSDFHKRIRYLRDKYIKDEPYEGHEFEYIFFARDGKKIPTNWMCSYKDNNLPDLFEAIIFECYSDYVHNNTGSNVTSYTVFFNDFIQTVQKVKAEQNNKRQVLSHENYY